VTLCRFVGQREGAGGRGEGGIASCLLRYPIMPCADARVIAVWVHSVDPFTRKEWYDVKAPSTFAIRNACKTCVNRTSGTSTFS